MTPKTYSRLNRSVDLTVVNSAGMRSLPLQAVAAAAVAMELDRPVLFRQGRPGLHGVPFQLVKLSTILPLEPGRGRIDDASRLTAITAATVVTVLTRRRVNAPGYETMPAFVGSGRESK